VPFRITPNIEQFIGNIGIQGLFAGVMTSASLAMSAQKDKT
jgi:phosphatidylinositol kinase/protein kinase (PI-3  family)